MLFNSKESAALMAKNKGGYMKPHQALMLFVLGAAYGAAITVLIIETMA